MKKADTYFTQSAFYDGTGDLTSYDSFGRNTRQKDYGLVLRTPGDPWDSFSDLLGFSDNSEQVKVHCNKEDPYILAPTEVLMYSILGRSLMGMMCIITGRGIMTLCWGGFCRRIRYWMG